MIQVYRCVGKLSLVRKAHNVIMSLWCSAFIIFQGDLRNFVRFVNKKISVILLQYLYKCSLEHV